MIIKQANDKITAFSRRPRSRYNLPITGAAGKGNLCTTTEVPPVVFRSRRPGRICSLLELAKGGSASHFPLVALHFFSSCPFIMVCTSPPPLRGGAPRFFKATHAAWYVAVGSLLLHTFNLWRGPVATIARAAAFALIFVVTGPRVDAEDQ